MNTTRRPAIESVGERFGMLVVTEVFKGERRAVAKAVCDCGASWEGTLNKLRSGNTSSCGCKELTFEDVTGVKFGRWTVLECVTKSAKGVQTTWKCRCECGTEAVVQAGALKNGLSRSCGCFAAENTGNRCRTHGMRHTTEWNIWSGIKARCYNKNSKDYKNYGARGITMFEGWIDDFEAFYNYMGPRPSEDHSVERRDNDVGYIPGNISWQTRVVQANNNRCNRLITIADITRTMVQWCEIYDVFYHTVAYRISQSKWDPLRALTTPTSRPFRGSKPYKTIDGINT